MSVIALKQPSALQRTSHEVLSWFRQMKAALQRPIPHDVAAGHIEFARMVDREISRIRLMSGDPRI